ncbi:uncharacterized protein LOC122319825 [Drosophila ficusphila]|uniref:uncharacterized protein LOC122319825 n=1 Tax=Drosophila ficusphila TaxID=30025 RepID=UPI001C8950BC|nr:uncharacterized protein LOC122319825 [Drosophila ficusphila]
MSQENSVSVTDNGNSNRVTFLKRKATSMFNRVERLMESLSSSALNSFDDSGLHVRLELIEELQTAFKRVLNELEELDFEEIGSELEEKFDDVIVVLKSTVRSEITKRSSQLQHSTFADDQLQIKKIKTSASVTGIGDSSFVTNGHSVNITMQSRTSEYTVNITAVIAPNITERQPSFNVDIGSWKIPQNIQLADPTFYVPQRLPPGLPLIQKTRLGWVVSGGYGVSNGSSLISTIPLPIVSRDNSLDRLDDLLRRFWEVESCVEPIAHSTKEEQDCEAHFKKHFIRSPAGDYSVRLPAKLNLELLGESYQQAYRRFLSLERKLDRRPALKAQYAAFIKEYFDLGHMSTVAGADLASCRFFLPHHCVTKEDSSTTKLRVVFDGSAATSSGYSLNDLLMAGPVIQHTLFQILIRFRSYPVAITGDICKMYRCVKVHPEDSYLQCILWRTSPQDKLQVFKLDTVTYGTKPASFLAVRAMHQLSTDEHFSFPLGAEVIQRDFYVDDLISGAQTVDEAIIIVDQTSKILSRGGFKLRKWCSNVPAALCGVSDEDKESYLKFDDGTDFTKTLGLAWDPASDQLLFSFSVLQLTSSPCRRSVLSAIARFYDPLGLVGPVIAKAKIFLQQLCKERLSWDESLPEAQNTEWNSICRSFVQIKRLCFPRLVLSPNSEIQVHGFCDASMEAYGACVYIVCSGQSQLLCSKSRVAPLKTLTVPKLELCGADLLSKLISEVAGTNVFKGQYYCWSDSAVALSWIRDEPSRFNMFVANRVAAIQERTDSMEWRYVPTSLNPADILSRGVLPTELSESPIWFNGPTFLCRPKIDWPSPILAEKSTLELRRKVLLIKSPYVDIIACSKFANSFASLQRIFGYVFKFINRIRQPDLKVSDIQSGTQLLLRLVQRSHLWEDIKSLQSKGVVAQSSSLASLSPFIDQFGLLRVDGRLRNSSLDFNARHPIILPRSHPVTAAIVTHFHERNLHTGPRALLCIVRSQYWPIGGRKTVSKVLNKCVRCFRTKPRLVEHVMADLPKERLDGSHAFEVTGIDFCGPFFYKPEVRNKAPVKCYVCVFICFATKAIHLELIRDLSTVSFLHGLKRFICTRRKPRQIWSDNATNFVGARNELIELRRLFLSDEHQKATLDFCLAELIDWRFIPPRSPHFGGLWEAAVKTAKHHFYRAIGPSVLAFDELRTLLCHISAVVNSRPLVSISENPADLDVLTPAHFLNGGPPSSFIEPDVTALNFNRLDGWQRVAYLQQRESLSFSVVEMELLELPFSRQHLE